ncbi:Clp protease N-terminal domain-containing protein [Solwaraspora sp. WMMA2101]|uniref:Clp protease N-terminal domain-containing protein n=1 Tax=Solwaraspora sp. WMMA2101 TaxID=3404124 RepID=UPI003B937D8E
MSRQLPRYRAGDPPPNWAPEMLKVMGVLPTTIPVVPQTLWKAVVTTGGYFLLRRPFHRHGTRYGHVIPIIVERDAALQAIRLGRTRTGTVEVLLSILDLHEQLHAAGVDLPEPVAQHNTAGQILRTQGVTLLAATVAAARSLDTPQVGADPTAVRSPPRPTASRTAPPLDPDAESALRTASMAARESGHPFAGTTHLLAGILRDRDGPAARLLRGLGADPEAIFEQTSVRPD